ncbi:MAG: fibronectin type III domain-containing protein [bacterium]
MRKNKRIETPSAFPAGILVLGLLAAAACGGGEAPDTTPPDAVTGLTAAAGDGEITLSWNASDADDFSHYRVYQGTSPTSMDPLAEEPEEAGLTISSGLADGTTYSFAVSAVDEAGNESSQAGPVQVTATSVVHETVQGWTAFEAEDYAGASSRFQQALDFDGGHADAHLGLGWTRAFLGELSDAAASLSAANSSGLSTPDAHAGLAVVYRDLPDLVQCVSRAAMVLTADASWSFPHRSSIDHQDMRLIRAQAYYRMGPSGYPDAQSEVDILDPANGLDPADPGTWSVDGQLYPTYAEALLKVIEGLAQSIGVP